MKSLFATVTLLILAASLVSVGLSANAGPADEAKQAYESRSYDSAGIAKAELAADLYGKLAAQAADPKEKAEYLVRQSEALYFAGDASDSKAKKLASHNQGYLIADQVVKSLGVNDVANVSDADLDALIAKPEVLPLLADALYQRGINLAKWGQANGVTSSLGKWPELRSTMELIGFLGMDAVHEYGASRTLGRAYFELPGVLGGSTTKAETYLATAVEKTATTAVTSPFPISSNGFNNLYYAEIMKYNGKLAVAKKLLTAFIAIDPSVLNPSSVIETAKAQEFAKADLKSW